MLIEQINEQHRPYGMIFTDISGGVTNTSAFAPQAFKVNPVMAYRLYPDGHKELVRGIDISGTPLVALQSIRAASREVETFNGVCGAESGWVPVSASAPSLLLDKLEVEKGFIPPDRPPILDARRLDSHSDPKAGPMKRFAVITALLASAHGVCQQDDADSARGQRPGVAGGDDRDRRRDRRGDEPRHARSS